MSYFLCNIEINKNEIKNGQKNYFVHIFPLYNPPQVNKMMQRVNDLVNINLE